jgi:hypothetical protein
VAGREILRRLKFPVVGKKQILRYAQEDSSCF